MEKDSDANSFLGTLLEGSAMDKKSEKPRHTDKQVERDPKPFTLLPDPSEQLKQARTKTCKRKLVRREGYKWPYYDSYAPGLGMNTQDKKIVRKGL